MNKQLILNFYKNEFHSFSNAKRVLVNSPHDGSVIAEVEELPLAQLDEVVSQAVVAQKKWAALTFKKRADVLYKYRELLGQYRQRLAEAIHLDNGKTLNEALAEVDKVTELTDFACSVPQIVSGETQKVSRGIFCREERRPVGVFGVITPFNFPVMVPNWSIPNALVLGNAVILKPSELVPCAIPLMAELWQKAGLPTGLFNVVHGGAELGQKLATHPQIAGVTFVGSTPVAKAVYQTAVSHNKRALCLGGAKNHVFALKDADPVNSAKEILSSAVGMAGQRCMALSVCLIVGDNPKLEAELVSQAKAYKLGENHPPIVSQKAIENMKKYALWAHEQGAKVLVNGATDFKAPVGKEKGYWHGPTLIDWSACPEKMGEVEVFGPVLEFVKTKNLSEAIAFQRKSPYGNSIAIFTQSGRAAEEIIEACSPGMIGVNVGVAVPREPFSFGGLNHSKFGYGDITGKSSINFWTNLVKVTFKWNPEDKVDWMS